MRRGRQDFWSSFEARGLNQEQSQGNQLLSGYEEEFVGGVDEDLMCPICQLPLRSPVVTSCGHRFCKGCIDKLHRENANRRNSLYAFVDVRHVTCPIDRTTLLLDADVFPDKFTERKILSLVIKCPKKDCEWTGAIREKEKHRECCPEEVVKCNNLSCGESMARKNLEEHVTTKCQRRKLRCEHCSLEHLAFKEAAHKLECKRFPVNCPRSCGKVMPREETIGHTASCPEEVVKCTSNNCKEKMKRKNLKEHASNTCQWRMLCCEHCSNQHPACQKSDHEAKCKKFPVKCPNDCGKTIPREEIMTHTDTDCPMAIVPCPFKEIDCQTMVCRSKLKSHIQAATSEHLDLTRIKLVSTNEEHEKLKQQIEEKFDKTIKEHKELKEITRKLVESFLDVLDQNERLKQTTRKLEEKLNYTVQLLTDRNK